MLKKALLGCGLLLLLPITFVGCISGVWLAPFPTTYKVEWDHGVSLPKSAVVLLRENTGVPWMDSHATAIVLLPSKDLPQLIRQLKPARAHYLRPGESWQQRLEKGRMSYRCYSNSSDGFLIVTTEPAQNGQVEVSLSTYTD